MSGNSIGKLFSVTTAGESHGPALGAIVDGCPAGLAIDDALSESFDDGCLTDASFSRENRVILAAPRQNIDQLPNFEIPPEDRVDFSGACFPG